MTTWRAIERLRTEGGGFPFRGFGVFLSIFVYFAHPIEAFFVFISIFAFGGRRVFGQGYTCNMQHAIYSY
jgi:hypothetical protein